MSDEELEFNMEVIDEISYAVLGCVDTNEGPLVAYSLHLAREVLLAGGMDDDDVVGHLESVTEGHRFLWVYPIEVVDIEWQPDPPKPKLKLVH